jgi:hypothetical protein
MRLIICVVLLAASVAYSGGVVLGPPPEPDTSSGTPGTPLPQEAIDCVIDAVRAGLDPVTECNLQ